MVSAQELAGIPLFEGLSEAELKKIARRLTRKKYKEGEIVFQEGGDGSQRLYVIESGAVRIAKRVDEQEEQTLAVLKPGEFFGEISLMNRKQHSAIAQALKDTSLLILSRDQLDELIGDDPALAYRILRKVSLVICGLLRQMDEKVIDMIKFVWEFGAKT